MKNPKVGPVTTLKVDFDKLQADVTRLRNDYLHSLAEFDNYRRRREKEMAEFRLIANENLLKELVPVLENFDRALQAAQGAASNGQASGDQGIVKGVRLIHTQLKETLGRLGFSEYSCLGEQFDPRRCEAVSFVETDEQAENTVVAETGKGYLFQNRVLRPALVIVARPKPSRLETSVPDRGDSGHAPEPQAERAKSQASADEGKQ